MRCIGDKGDVVYISRSLFNTCTFKWFVFGERKELLWLPKDREFDVNQALKDIGEIVKQDPAYLSCVLSADKKTFLVSERTSPFVGPAPIVVEPEPEMEISVPYVTSVQHPAWYQFYDDWKQTVAGRDPKSMGFLRFSNRFHFPLEWTDYMQQRYGEFLVGRCILCPTMFKAKEGERWGFAYDKNFKNFDSKGALKANFDHEIGFLERLSFRYLTDDNATFIHESDLRMGNDRMGILPSAICRGGDFDQKWLSLGRLLEDYKNKRHNGLVRNLDAQSRLAYLIKCVSENRVPNLSCLEPVPIPAEIAPFDDLQRLVERVQVIVEKDKNFQFRVNRFFTDLGLVTTEDNNDVLDFSIITTVQYPLVDEFLKTLENYIVESQLKPVTLVQVAAELPPVEESRPGTPIYISESQPAKSPEPKVASPVQPKKKAPARVSPPKTQAELQALALQTKANTENAIAVMRTELRTMSGRVTTHDKEFNVEQPSVAASQYSLDPTVLKQSLNLSDNDSDDSDTVSSEEDAEMDNLLKRVREEQQQPKLADEFDRDGVTVKLIPPTHPFRRSLSDASHRSNSSFTELGKALDNDPSAGSLIRDYRAFEDNDPELQTIGLDDDPPIAPDAKLRNMAIIMSDEELIKMARARQFNDLGMLLAHRPSPTLSLIESLLDIVPESMVAFRKVLSDKRTELNPGLRNLKRARIEIEKRKKNMN